MHHSQRHRHGRDFWSNQNFVQLPHQHGQSTASQYSDVCPFNGQLSDALKHKLAEEDLLDMEVLLRYRGIRTLRALETLETTERAVLLCKARQFYELLGIFPSNLKNTLNKLFGDVPPSGAMPYMHSQWAGQVWPITSIPECPEPLTCPLDDDTYLKRVLDAALLGASDIVGWERYTECLRRLKRSDELIVASCSEAAEALAALSISMKDVRDGDCKEALKAAKLAVRDVLLWRCTGNTLGLDSMKALVRAFQQAVKHTHCDCDTVSQLTNGYRRIREELAGGPRPKNRIATSPARGEQAGARSQEKIAVVPKIVPARLDPNAPSSSDPVLPHSADSADLHKQKPVLVQASSPCSSGLNNFNGDKLTECRSLPPSRRSPGPRSRDSGHSMQMAEMMDMMKAMSHQVQIVTSQLARLQQSSDPFPFRPIFSDDED